MTALTMLTGGPTHTVPARSLQRGDCFELGSETLLVVTVTPGPCDRVQIIGRVDAGEDAAALLLPGGIELAVTRGAA